MDQGSPSRAALTESVAVGDGAQLTRHEVVWRPGAGYRHMAIFEMTRGRVIAVLVLGYGVGIDQVGEVDEHAARVGALADHVLFQGRKQLVHLHRERPRFGLPFAV